MQRSSNSRLKDAVPLQCSKLLMPDLQSALQSVLSECRLTERAGSRAMPASAASLRGTLAHFLGKAKVYTWHWLSGGATHHQSLRLVLSTLRGKRCTIPRSGEPTLLISSNHLSIANHTNQTVWAILGSNTPVSARWGVTIPGVWEHGRVQLRGSGADRQVERQGPLCSARHSTRRSLDLDRLSLSVYPCAPGVL